MPATTNRVAVTEAPKKTLEKVAIGVNQLASQLIKQQSQFLPCVIRIHRPVFHRNIALLRPNGEPWCRHLRLSNRLNPNVDPRDQLDLAAVNHLAELHMRVRENQVAYSKAFADGHHLGGSRSR